MSVMILIGIGLMLGLLLGIVLIWSFPGGIKRS